MEHRIGGIEKQDVTGNVSYDPHNHEHMCETRAQKVYRVLADVPDVEVYGDTAGLCVVSWGGTHGAVRAAVEAARADGRQVGHVHLRWLNPLPRNLGDVLRGFERVLVPELNLGQLSAILRARYLVDAWSYTKIQGQPFKVAELVDRIHRACARV
jgi:2-oxoglutarate ferredoxin oxidoreductase subunit alpha